MKLPFITQYLELKKKHPDAVLLFRIGDFYELFGNDAKIASEILGIILIRRANGKDKFIELAGFPHHALDTYLPKLVRAGKRVAICEQLEDPNPNKTSATNAQIDRLFSILKVYVEILNKLSIFEKIRLKTQEIRSLASDIGISPKKAFEECYKINQPSLFD